MLNIVLPLAGKGQRFLDVGFTVPKPLIPVHGIPMIEVVLNNLKPGVDHRFIFIARAEHLEDDQLRTLLETATPNSIVIPISEVTEGPACSVLLAKKFIDSAEPLMIANCDQWVDIDFSDYVAAALRPGVDGTIMTMKADHPKWSYAKVDAHGFVTETAEKIVISNEATVGIYNFTRGSDFVSGAEQMIQKGLRVNNEFYVAPVYNELISLGRKFTIYNVGSEYDGMYGLGTPDDLKTFLALPISRTATENRTGQR